MGGASEVRGGVGLDHTLPLRAIVEEATSPVISPCATER